jgi:hypothetical protein
VGPPTCGIRENDDRTHDVLDLGRPRIVGNNGEGKAIKWPIVMPRKVGRDNPFAGLRMARNKSSKKLNGAGVEALQEKSCAFFGRVNCGLHEK